MTMNSLGGFLGFGGMQSSNRPGDIICCRCGYQIYTPEIEGVKMKEGKMRHSWCITEKEKKSLGRRR